MTYVKSPTKNGKHTVIRVRGELLARLQTMAVTKGYIDSADEPNVASLAQTYLLVCLERDEQEIRDLAAKVKFKSLGPNVRYWRKEITGQKIPCVKLVVEQDGWNSVYLPGSAFAGELCITSPEELVEVIPGS